ncbi:MAG: hypothetical protein BWX84_01644 [Verrucomicrobia bacterium ADurb.Bin118]|nr:MAG: hypothetical protein BWX84_01644 [Verrucomicrobia bacterium ADurb.Bin118]
MWQAQREPMADFGLMPHKRMTPVGCNQGGAAVRIAGQEGGQVGLIFKTNCEDAAAAGPQDHGNAVGRQPGPILPGQRFLRKRGGNTVGINPGAHRQQQASSERLHGLLRAAIQDAGSDICWRNRHTLRLAITGSLARILLGGDDFGR